MTDRYLFRGKRIDNGEWVYWDIFGRVIEDIYNADYLYLCDICEYEIDPATIGQCTGLRDKNGRLIFEGDIVKWGHLPKTSENPIRIAEVKQCPDIQFHSNVGVFRYGSFAYHDTENHLEIIGSIHDNPELLEERSADT